jgi:glycolate oxidase iron-sulfur subunit
MQTNFSLAQLADPDVAESERILRTCVHCGFCTATCPTYVLLGDELDSPRGRIYLIKDMLETDQPATRGGQAHRPLPVLSLLHDHLPVGRALHASGRSRRASTSRRPIDTRPAGPPAAPLLAFVLPHPRASAWRCSAPKLAGRFAGLCRGG